MGLSSLLFATQKRSILINDFDWQKEKERERGREKDAGREARRGEKKRRNRRRTEEEKNKEEILRVLVQVQAFYIFGTPAPPPKRQKKKEKKGGRRNIQLIELAKQRLIPTTTLLVFLKLLKNQFFNIFLLKKSLRCDYIFWGEAGRTLLLPIFTISTSTPAGFMLAFAFRLPKRPQRSRPTVRGTFLPNTVSAAIFTRFRR